MTTIEKQIIETWFINHEPTYPQVFREAFSRRQEKKKLQEYVPLKNNARVKDGKGRPSMRTGAWHRSDSGALNSLTRSKAEGHAQNIITPSTTAMILRAMCTPLCRTTDEWRDCGR